jgi:hypothetical protein
MFYSHEQLKTAMTEAASGLPTKASEVAALREKMLNARDAIGEYESRIAEARRARNLWNVDALEANLEQARVTFTDSQRELQRVGSYGAALQAAEHAKAQAAEQERQREADQLAFAAQQEIEAQAEYLRLYLGNGGTPERFEIAWPGLWEAELNRRTLQGTDALRQRLLSSGKYS